jgi:hypothetical protein
VLSLELMLLLTPKLTEIRLTMAATPITMPRTASQLRKLLCCNALTASIAVSKIFMPLRPSS